MIIGGYKAIGKTTLASKYKQVINLESSNYEYIIDDELKKLSVEQRKGLKSRKKNPEYHLNYYNQIIKKKIIFYKKIIERISYGICN